MRIDALSAAAVAVAGLAVYAYMKPKGATSVAPATAAASSTMAGATVDPSVAQSAADAAYAQAVVQRQGSGAAVPTNTNYLQNWQGLTDVFASQPDFSA